MIDWSYTVKDGGKLLLCCSSLSLNDIRISDEAGRTMEAPLLTARVVDGRNEYLFDTAKLRQWSPESPALYHLTASELNNSLGIGIVELKTIGNSTVLVNGNPYFFRGYIRGIVAHDHPNFSGKSNYESYCYHIRQAKKYGFNLVRFHSTIPDEDFVRAADELGLFIHMEIGFAYDYDAEGNRTGLALDNTAWRETILRYRNHPSVAIFCIGNEMHNSGHQPGVRRLYEEGKKLAPEKLIMDNSGWGDFDRTTADIYSQHIAYFFPYKQHRDMFTSDACWHLNGSVYDTPMESSHESVVFGNVEARRNATPLKPVLAHEAMHYIEIPDYEALNRKFDEFAARVGENYLAQHKIRKPRYLVELPELIRKKGISPERMEQYRAASRKWKKFAIKTYLERLRLSQLCGFEMLQFADCFKYENKNGIVDFFDDDKFFTPEWMARCNGEVVLLADMAEECYLEGVTVSVALSLSHFGRHPEIPGTLRVYLQNTDDNGEILYVCEKIACVPGVQKLADVKFTLPAVGKAQRYTLRAEFGNEMIQVENEWQFWSFPPAKIKSRPVLKLADARLASFFQDAATDQAEKSDLQIYDRLSEALLADLEAGKRVLLLYHRDNLGQYGYLPGALDRFKPCIWDRGSNLGGIVNAAFVREALAAEDEFFDAQFQSLCEGGYKLDLDHFPGKAEELICGVDKPVRDRMKGLIQKVKDFLPDDTLRNFNYLTSWKIGSATLIVSTFQTTSAGTNPAAGTYYAALADWAATHESTGAMTLEELKQFITSAEVIHEDVMNHFWELDNKPVEDTLFWEECGLDLSKIE